MAIRSSPSELLLIKKCCDRLFNSGWSLDKIRDSVLVNRLLESSGDDAIGIPGRSVVWKLFLTAAEPLQTISTLTTANALTSLRSSRKAYMEILLEKLRAPDGSYEEGFAPPSSIAKQKRNENADANLDMNNPLSLHKENPWKEWFAAVELRKMIKQDVERTFPDIPFFRDPDVQYQLITILFLYSATNPTIGYRQGMHELLAPLYYTTYYDAQIIQQNSSNDANIEELCSQAWVAADAWSLFNGVMMGVSRWYEWQEAPEPREIKPYVAPIVESCNYIQRTLLKSVDATLYQHLQDSGIEPQIYGIRWLRLLFTREFNMYQSMKLWDGMFVCDPSMDLALWVCVAMLIRIRQQLLAADYSGQLTLLLRYPVPPSDKSQGSNHINLLLRQGRVLQSSPTPATGAAIALENRGQLSTRENVSKHVTPNATDRKEATSQHRSASTAGHRTSASPVGSGSSHSRQQSSASQLGLPEMITRGLLERGESLGINKSFMTAVSELRKNMPDIAGTFARPPSSSTSTIAMNDDRAPEERPPWEPRSRFEMERELQQLKARNKKLGGSLVWIVDALLQGGEDQNNELLKKNKREALESLSYVRDALLSERDALEDDRLIGEEEAKRRKLREVEQAQVVSKASALGPPSPPPAVAIPVSSSEIRNKQLAERQISKSPPSSTSSPLNSPSPSVITPSTSPPSSRLAPWAYTKSNFSSTSVGFPTGMLPRLPPPTSTTSPGLATGRTDQTPQDPLGAIR